MATNQQATTEELLEAVLSVVRAQPLLRNGAVNKLLYKRRAVFSRWSVPKVYQWVKFGA
jgi:hypothetical protein